MPLDKEKITIMQTSYIGKRSAFNRKLLMSFQDIGLEPSNEYALGIIAKLYEFITSEMNQFAKDLTEAGVGDDDKDTIKNLNYMVLTQLASTFILSFFNRFIGVQESKKFLTEKEAANMRKMLLDLRNRRINKWELPLEDLLIILENTSKTLSSKSEEKQAVDLTATAEVPQLNLELQPELALTEG